MKLKIRHVRPVWAAALLPGLLFAWVALNTVYADLYDFRAPGASLSLADYDFNGENIDDESGCSVAGGGDVDGDGLTDILIGARGNDAAGTDAGKVYLIRGSSLGGTTSISLSAASCEFIGENAGDEAGYSVAWVDDLDGDGYDEILIGAPGEDTGGADAGMAYIVNSSSLGSTTSLSLASADYTIIGENAGDEAGYSVAGAGDVDGDGFGDIFIGAPYEDTGGSSAGKSYLIMGDTVDSLPWWDTTLNLGTDEDFSFTGANASDYIGRAIAGDGDVDGDTFDDLILGARYNDDAGTSAGKTYIFLASTLSSSLSSSFSVADADYNLTGENAGDYSGCAVAITGDIDGDGHDEILIGAFENDDTDTGAGKTYLVLGASLGGTSSLSLSSADYFFTGDDYEDWSGWDVAGAGDVDGDGLEDILIVVANSEDNGTNPWGQVHLFLASTITGLGSSTVSLSSADYILIAENIDDFDDPVAVAAGDVNGDGLDDVLVGDPDFRANNEGKTYLILGTDCHVTDTIYVDGLYGSPSGPGGEACPYDTINGGILAAVSAGITQVVVKGWFYDEVVTLDSDIELEGEIRWDFLPPFILGSGSSSYHVEGADRSSMSNFVVYEGGIQLDGVNEMTLQGNVVYISDNWWAYCLYLLGGASDNTVRNNILYKRHMSGIAVTTQPVVCYIDSNSDDNTFINNTLHSRDYTGYGPYTDVIGVYLEDYTDGNEFRNNIIETVAHYTAGGLRYGFYMNWSSGSSSTATIEYNKTPADNYDPLGLVGSTNLVMSRIADFVDPMPYGFDYRLNATSVCVDAGDPDSAYDDTDGTQNDMGAYGGPEPLGF